MSSRPLWTTVLATLAGGALAGLASVPPALAKRAPVEPPFARGVHAFHDGAYAQAEEAFAAALKPSKGAPPVRNVDWVTYLLAESAFFAGHIGIAQDRFESLAHNKTSRFSTLSAFRVADCLWATGNHGAAVDRYRKLPARPPTSVDAAVARFRIASFSDEQHSPDAGRLFLAFYRDFPAHPWAEEARKHLPVATPTETKNPGSNAITPADRLRRAETLTRDRNWQQALDELAALPADLAPPLSVERDYQIGMTKFHMRRDYGKAAELLLAAAPALTGDKAASAWFHGTRALSRIDRDDEAIAGYKQVVARFPSSRFAPEAQFLSGWLDYNRGRYREGLPGLQATLDRFGKSAFADDAAWCLAFAHYLLGNLPEAAKALDRYAAMPPTGMTAEERTARVAYWRARLLAKGASQTPPGSETTSPAALTAYRDVNRRFPFTFYGAAARARLAETKVRVDIELAPAPAKTDVRANRKDPARDAVWSRVDELAEAGLDVEAGWELERAEKSLLKGKDANADLPRWLRKYADLKNFHRAYELAESRHAGALGTAPSGAARIWWEAAYPLAYRSWVDTFAPAAGNPELFLFAIMRKESGFSPWDVSYADARGLLQMIPPTSARVAHDLQIDFEPDDLYDPEVNIRLGAEYIGGLAKKFHGQIPLLAGAYNAGPKAMAKWCDQHGKHPVDEFVELIAFTQTREYAKRVVGIYARYRHLYGPSDYDMPLKIDSSYTPGGPDY